MGDSFCTEDLFVGVVLLVVVEVWRVGGCSRGCIRDIFVWVLRSITITRASPPSPKFDPSARNFPTPSLDHRKSTKKWYWSSSGFLRRIQCCRLGSSSVKLLTGQDGLGLKAWLVKLGPPFASVGMIGEAGLDIGWGGYTVGLVGEPWWWWIGLFKEVGVVWSFEKECLHALQPSIDGSNQTSVPSPAAPQPTTLSRYLQHDL